MGLKLSCSLVDDMEDRSPCSEHPVPGLSNLAEISGMNHWSVMFGVKYFFGE